MSAITAAMPAPVALAAMIALASAPASAIEGYWKNPVGSAIIRVAECGPQLCGTVVWASERGKREVAANTSTIVGTTVLTDVKAMSRNSWKATLFIPDDNMHVGAKLQLIGERKLKLTGCAFVGLLCRSQIWNRYDRPLPKGD